MENLTEKAAAISAAAAALSEALTDYERAGGVTLVRVIDASTIQERVKVVTVLTGPAALFEMRQDKVAA